MKQLILLCVLLAFALGQLSAQELKQEKYDDGTTKAEGAYNSQGIKTGLWKYYYSNGKLEAEGSYTGNVNDATLEVIRKGRTSAVDDQKAGRTGKWTYYYSNGERKATLQYDENGCPEGTLTKWYKTGEKMEEAIYEACEASVNKKVWAQEGWLKYETIDEGNGRSVQVEWYESGQKKAVIPFKDGNQYGRVKRWYENGKKEEEVMMKNTRVHGSYRSWYPNGKKQREFFSINNVMSGEYREWDEAGTLIWEIREMNDVKKIEVINYWPDGTLKMKGKSNLPPSLSIHQWSQTRDGYWTYWYEGNVTRSEKYDDGRLLTVEMP